MWTSDKMKAAHTSLAAATLFSSFASAVEYLSISGANFVSNSTGDRFDIIGVTYERNPNNSSRRVKPTSPRKKPKMHVSQLINNTDTSLVDQQVLPARPTLLATPMPVSEMPFSCSSLVSTPSGCTTCRPT